MRKSSKTKPTKTNKIVTHQKEKGVEEEQYLNTMK